MSYPILKPSNTWFIPNVSTINRGTITVINIVDSYTPTTTPTDSWDASISQDGSITVYVEGTKLTISGNGSGKIATNEDASYMFAEFGSVTSINGLDILDTSNTTNMSYMFFKSYGLLSIDVSSFNVSNVKTMEYMFGSDNKSYGMKLTSITFGENFNTSNVTSFFAMFRFCMSLPEVDISMFDTSSAKDLSRLFDRCNSLMQVDVSGFDTKTVENMSTMFQRCYALKTLDLSGWDTSNCEDMSYMFNDCKALTELKAEHFNTSKVKNFECMFQECRALSNLSVANFDTSSCENFSFMFYGCTSLKTIDFENWDVSKGKTFDHFLSHSKMQKYDVSKWNVTSACENLNAIFHSTRETYIDVTGWDTSNVIAFNQLCDGMSYLEKIDGLETWNTSKGVCFGEMFRSCGSLKEIDLSSFDTRNADEGTPISGNNSTSYGLWYMFAGCNSLKKLTLGENFTRYGNGNISSGNYAYFPTPTTNAHKDADGMWYTMDGNGYAPADVPDLTAGIYYASPTLAIWDRDSKKYIHLAAMRQYHNMLNAETDTKIDTLKEDIGNIEDQINNLNQAITDKADKNYETWMFTLADGTVIEKQVLINA